MRGLGTAAASLVSAMWLGACGAAGDRAAPDEASPRTASLGVGVGDDFGGIYLWVHGTRSTAVDGRYPCLSEVVACLPLDASGKSAPLVDLCPSADTPEGTWDFDFALYTDPDCSAAVENVGCAVARGRTLGPGANPAGVVCVTGNARKDFTVCLYDPETKAGYGNCERVLIVTGGVPESLVEDVRAKQKATGRFLRVDALDASCSTPTLAELSDYTVVLTFTDHHQSLGYFDPVALGDTLAAYFDSGGRVVSAVFANASIPLLGRFQRDYMLIEWRFPQLGTESHLGTILDPASPLLADVSTLSATVAYRSQGSVIRGEAVAEWSDGRPLIVRGTVIDAGGASRNRVDLNLYPPSSDVGANFWIGDGTEIVRNALLYK